MMRKRATRWYLALLGITFLMACGARAASWQHSDEVQQLFEAAGVTGTFVVYDLADDRLIGFNRARAEERFIPASTFKIPHTLIGLATAAVSSVDEVLPYGGKPQLFPNWEKDLPLREAIRVSSVPVYQELARRVGRQAMTEHVRALDYGNAAVGEVVDNFWLVGPLKISAVEQSYFLARLAEGRLPYPAALQQQVREIAFLEAGDGWQLYGKTGWAADTNPGIGWWTGWLVKGDQLYSFALNMEMNDISHASQRVLLGKQSLQALGLLP